MFLSVVIPVFNEEKRLPGTLKKVRDYLNRQDYSWEVLIVNDGSKDLTAQVVEALIKDWPNFRLIDNKENKGKGAVVKQGMLQAKGDWRLFMDADNSTDVSEIQKLWDFANHMRNKSQNPTSNQISKPKSQIGKLENCDLNGHCDLELGAYDVIIGSRYLNKDSIKIKQPLIRRMVSRIGNWLIRILLGIDMKDTQCGFKLFSAKAAEDIFPKQTIMRWGFDMEILAIAIKKGYKIKEVAVDWYDSTGSQVKKSAALKTLKELFTIKWNLLKGRYN